MYDLAKMFLHCLNHWKLETPNARKQTMTAEELKAYKVNYPRWLCYCHVPGNLLRGIANCSGVAL